MHKIVFFLVLKKVNKKNIKTKKKPKIRINAHIYIKKHNLIIGFIIFSPAVRRKNLNRAWIKLKILTIFF